MTNARRVVAEGMGRALLVALCVLAWQQFAWMGTDLATTISHGINEDWDWQLSLYEVSRLTILEHGQLPAWNPFTQGGVPLLANPESPFLYPPFLLVLALGSSAGLKLWVLLHLWALVGAAWWAGREAGLGPVEAHGAGALILVSAFVPEFVAYGHIMYLPLCWLLLAWIAMRRGRWRLVGLCMAMTVLAGAHYLVLYGALWLVADVVFRSLEPRRAMLLGAWLMANLLLLGQSWATWPLAALGVVVLACQRPHPEGVRWRTALLLVAAAGLAVALAGPKLTTLPALWERAERLAPQVSLSIADEYTPWRALQVLLGLVERPSGHEGQNVLYSPVPLVLAGLGSVVALRRRPAVALTGLLFLVVGWGGSTPVNLLQALHRLPAFDQIRVVERYSLVWTLFIGWFAGWGARALWDLEPGRVIARPVVLGAVAWHLWVAVPESARHYRIGAGRPHPIPPAGAFVQVDDELTNWEAIRANRGKPRCWTTAWLADPGPVLAREDEGYRGEAFYAEGEGLALAFSPNRLELQAPRPGRVVVNQNAYRGWYANGRPASSDGGLLAADVEAGAVVFEYRPPGLRLGLALLGLGLAALLIPRRWLRPLRRRAPASPGPCRAGDP